MRIGILGSGLMGGKLGTLFAWAGHEVTFSYARSIDKLRDLAAAAGHRARAVSPAEAVRDAKVVLLAVHWSQVDDVLSLAGNLSGQTVITCSLPMTNNSASLIVGHAISGAESLAARLPEARIISAFGSTPSEVLLGVFEAKSYNLPPSLVYCGDDDEAKQTVAGLISDLGFDPLDAGPLSTARYIEPFSLLVAQIANKGVGHRGVCYRILRR